MTIGAYIQAMFPELMLLAAAIACLFLGLFGTTGRRLVAPCALFFTVLTILLLMRWCAVSMTQDDPAFEMASGLAVTSLSIYVRLITLVVGAVLILVNWYQAAESERGEYFSMVLFSMVGVMLVASSNDLIILFFGLELVSVPTYVLVAISRTDVRAQEASSKYFFLGALAAALTAYGLSFLYGISGTTTMFSTALDTPAVATAIIGGEVESTHLTVGLLLVFGGLCFKIAAVPMHAYVADVYHGAAAPLAGLLGFLPKLGGFVGLIQLFSLTGWEPGLPVQWAVWVVAALTMTTGNVLALLQTNVKRLLAYSGVAHSGYMLIGLLVGPGLGGTGPLRDGVSALLFYVLVYGLMNLGTFAVLTYLTSGERETEDQQQLAGLARTQPMAALALAVCLFSLMGMPPTAGFLGKVYIFSSAIALSAENSFGTPMLWLVVIGVINSAVAAAYYLRVVGVCYLRPRSEQLPPKPRFFLQVGTAVCALLMIVIFVVPTLFVSASQEATSQTQTTDFGGY